MADEEFTDWIQLADAEIILATAASSTVGDAGGSIDNGYAAVDAPIGTMTWQRSLTGDYPQEELDAFQTAWRAARQAVFDTPYYYNATGPYSGGAPFAPNPPGPTPTDDDAVNNRDGDNLANNALSYLFLGATSVGDHGTLTVTVRGSAMAFEHVELLQGAGPFGDGQSFPPDPLTYFDGYFAAGAHGRAWEVEYEADLCTAVDVAVRPAEYSDAFGGSESDPQGATWYFQPITPDGTSWGNYYNPSEGYAFGTFGGQAEEWTAQDGVSAIGADGGGSWQPIDWEAAVAQEAITGWKGYGFVALLDCWSAIDPPELPPGGTDFTVSSVRRKPLVDFKLIVTPVRFRAHYFATDDEPAPEGSPSMGSPRRTFQRGR